ncbi:hypothetical protein ACWGSK_25200 [Nocardiopsis sp. NPDC055551]|nr:hypothetical protein BQ8420_19480 [Nocardiopsis sp. JB363]
MGRADHERHPGRRVQPTEPPSSWLRGAGYRVAMLTGDNHATVTAPAARPALDHP